jgi:hypothetical protein
MKRFYLLLTLATAFLISCNQHSTNSGTNDSTGDQVIPPASDNSRATNPSLADTAYRDSLSTDSSRRVR